MLSDYQAILFTSSNGVRAFEMSSSIRDNNVFTVGDKSAEKAKNAGFHHVTSANGDLRKLSDTINDQLNPDNGSLLYICGKHQSGDLKQTLNRHNFIVDKYEIYEMIAASYLSEQTQDSLKKQEIDYIPFYSVRSAHIFIELIKKAELQYTLSTISALCLSPAIEKVIETLKWKNIMTSETPDQYTLFKLIDIEL